MVEQPSDLKLQEAFHESDDATDKAAVSGTQDQVTIIDEDRPRSLDHATRQEEALVVPKGANAIEIINLLSSSASSTTGFLPATDEVDETTSSLASFDISHEESDADGEKGGKLLGGPLLTLVVNSPTELVTAAIMDPIEGHDGEFDVDLSSPPLTEDEISTNSTTDSQTDAPIVIEGRENEAQAVEGIQGIRNPGLQHGNNSDCEHIEPHSQSPHGHPHGSRSGGIYGKVVKSIQKSIRKIFQPKEQPHLHQHHEKVTASLYIPSLDIPSVAISPLLPSNNPITSAANAVQNMPPLMDGSLHKTLVIDVAYSKPLLDLPSPVDVGKKCLVLDLDETLVHSTFQPVPNADLIVPVHLGEGLFQPIYVCKRPGVDEFLRQVSELFEVVIFTASLSNYADPVIDFLDLVGGIKFRLYREDCLQFQGMYIKDLSRLGRDLDQVLIIDNSPASYSMQPTNALGCRSWFKDPHDRELEERILPMLLKLHASPTVTHWRGENLVNIETPY